MPKNLRVYTLNDLPPEVRAVTFAKCSRSPEPFDEIAKELTAEKSAEFHEKWVVGYGHASVGEHAILSLAIENVSILATKMIEDTRLASYTEKSTRYQIFSRETCYYPKKIMDSDLAATYEETINFLFDTYERLSEPMAEFIRKKYPPETDQPEVLYKNICKSKTCDNIRYLLPIATLTNLGMTANARIIEHLIKKLLSSPLDEFQEIGRMIKEAGMKEVPTLIKYANTNQYLQATENELQKIAGDKFSAARAEVAEPVTIVDYDRNAENKLVAAILYRFSHLPYNQIYRDAEIMNQAEKEKIIDESLSRRDKFDQPIRELENIYYTFDILMDYGAFRDIQRHRMCTQINQLATTVHGYEIPPEIIKAGFENDYRAAMDKANTAFEQIAVKFPLEAQYVVPLAYRKRTLITWNLRELHHFISLRSGKKGHASYRRIAQLCWHKLNEIQPLLAKYIRVDMDETGTSWAANLTTEK